MEVAPAELDCCPSCGKEAEPDWERLRALPRKPRVREILAFRWGERRIFATVDRFERAFRLADDIAPMPSVERRRLLREGCRVGRAEMAIDLYHATFAGGAPFKSAGFSFAFANQCGELTSRRSPRGRLLCNAEVYLDRAGEGERLWAAGGGVWGCELFRACGTKCRGPGRSSSLGKGAKAAKK